jgi:hypothetical protein
MGKQFLDAVWVKPRISPETDPLAALGNDGDRTRTRGLVSAITRARRILSGAVRLCLAGRLLGALLLLPSPVGSLKNGSAWSANATSGTGFSAVK